MRSPVAMVSYSWEDNKAAELLHDELALRCFDVIHDRYSFTDGSRVLASMAAGVDTCDVFVAYLTPHSLYLDRPSSEPRPALVGELLPALRRRRANLATGEVDNPILILLSHGLGDRKTAGEAIRRVTGEQVDSLWSMWLDQETDHITQAEAAEAADRALRAFLRREPPVPPIDLFVATRGTRPPARRFTIDGTRLLGGDRRPGNPRDWARVAAALHSIRSHLVAVSGGGVIRIELASHLSAAFAAGRSFHQATRWSPVFASRHGEIRPAADSDSQGLNIGLDPYAESGDLLVEIDLIGHSVSAFADELATRMPPSGGRITVTRDGGGDLSRGEISKLARATADRIREAHATLGPERIHLTLAAPAAYAALLGHHLTALQADIVTYELGDSGYAEALRIFGTTP